MSDKFLLISGNKEQSSWSMRAWLMLKIIGINFETKFINLSSKNYKTEILQYSLSGKVPLLIHNDLYIGDSLAIGEYLNELFPEANLYPSNLKERTLARSLVNEMHSGFIAIRSTMPFTLTKQDSYNDSPDLQKEIARIEFIWLSQRSKYQNTGKFLFGEFGLIDAMFAPIVIRFAKYGYVSKHQIVIEYTKSILEHQFVKEWIY
ncbi:MAG: glutathione S-transferase [Burkholderiales bacterium]|nr:glutathione S-transferase [Burkholderiales bacterium]